MALSLPGKSGPLGNYRGRFDPTLRFQQDEISYLVNVANLLGLTLQNLRLFEQVTTAQQQWAYTFDSIGDPILVHDRESDSSQQSTPQPSCWAARRTPVGRKVTNLLPRKECDYEAAPIAKESPAKATIPIRGCPAIFWHPIPPLPIRRDGQLGTVHVLKDITDRKRAEEKYRTLISNVQEGVFISTPAGRFLDFNDALMRMLGYEHRDELMSADIAARCTSTLRIATPEKLLHEHGSVADFEFEMRRKDGEVRTMMESSIAVRDTGEPSPPFRASCSTSPNASAPSRKFAAAIANSWF